MPLSSLSDVGILYSRLREWSKAEKMLEHVLRTRRETLGSGDRDTIAAQSALGLLYKRM